MRRSLSFLKTLFHRAAVEADLDGEVKAFYETLTQPYLDQGMTPPEARRLAR